MSAFLRACLCVRAYVYTRIHVCTFVCVNVCMCVYVYMYVHTKVYICMYVSFVEPKLIKYEF